jgi:threonyl-tRNA synthetase
MPLIRLPDDSQRSFAEPVTALQVAQSIGPGLAKAALAARVNDQLVDLSHLLTEDSDLAIITAKDAEGLEVLRHSCAHLLAMAVKELFPQAQVTIGPVIADGFYYDFAYQRPFALEDLAVIEAKMLELAKQAIEVERFTMGREAAIEFFQSQGEDYKVKIIEDIDADQALSFYRQGGFVDLCRGPHVPNTDRLTAFKLTKVAGAYWRGDSNNEMLSRIYGTCWADKKQLKAYLTRLAEAEKRDHRKLGKQLNLFHIQEEAPGMVFWHPDGWHIYQTLAQFIRHLLAEHGYQEINTPQLLDRTLWEKSGHWDKFNEDMFSVAGDHRDYALKPMNCPGHVQVFNQGVKSYKDLPVRYAEFGCCIRNEDSGALHGLMRVRGFTQDDAHIFCMPQQIRQEVSDFIDLLFATYRQLGFDTVQVKLSTRPDQRIGSDEIWDRAEQDLATVLDEKQLNWQELAGEGAFYGPKIEFSLVDCLERVWQCGTMQLDFSMPQRLAAHYIAEDGSKQIPVMLHRAILGSFERFIGILLEHYAGALPPWLAPTQAVILNITDKQASYCEKITSELRQKGLKVKLDLRNEKIGFKIRQHTLLKVPYLLIIGDREVANQQVAVRTRQGADLGTMTISDFTTRLTTEIAKRGTTLEE